VKLVVEIVGGARRGRRLEFADPPALKFGRHPSCDVAFDPELDRDASARHAELRREGALYCLYDLDSANGTAVDGRPVRGRTPVAPGAEIEFGVGGPRCRVHYVGVAATVPPTRLKPARRGRRFWRIGLSAAAAAVAVVAAAAVRVALRVRVPPKKPLSGAEIARANHDAVFLLSIKADNGDEAGFCSAFAVDPHRLVTNAHCIALSEEYLTSGGVLSAIQNGHAEVRFRVKAWRRSAGFRPHAEVITPDVGWLEVDGTLAQSVQLASREQLWGISVGDVIYSYGFPGRLSDVAAPEATFMQGVIGRITGLDGRSDKLDKAQLIQHSAFTSGGTSGSPIFDGEGRVVAVNTGGYLEADRASGAQVVTRPLPGYNFAMRVDLVEDLLKEAAHP
jgi:S1-C subfamily serine protease